jgi:hypothetical protein
MKVMKYLGMFLCVLLIIGTLPSVVMISRGLIAGSVNDLAYFVVKLVIYIAIILALVFLSVRLFRSANR